MKDIHFEIRTIDFSDPTCKITIHERFRASSGADKNAADKKGMLSTLLANSTSVLFYPPIFIGDSTSLTLVARQWVWTEHMAKSLYEFQALVISDASLLPEIIRADADEIERLTADSAVDATKRNTTMDREKCRAAGRICPFCGGVLRQPRSLKEREKDGGYLVRCENNVKDTTSKNHGHKCNFVINLTDVEIIKFKNYELNIKDILQPVDGVCPKCEGKLYKRTITKSTGITAKKRCRNVYSSIDPCTYGEVS